MIELDLENLPENPVDITEFLIPELKDISGNKKVSIFAIKIEYLLNNIQRLQQENKNDYYLLSGTYDYFSPVNWSYDFTDEKNLKTHPGIQNEPAIILQNQNPIAFFLDMDLVLSKPRVISKVYSETKKLDSMKLNLPLFSMNQNPKTKDLVSLILLDFEDLYIHSNQTVYPKWGSFEYQ